MSASEAQEFPPALRNMGRILAGMAGLAAGAAMLFFGGLYALFTSCVDYDGATAVCGGLGWLVGPLELVAVFGGAAAAIGGAMGTVATGQARWIACGLAVTVVLTILLTYLVGVQQLVMT